MEDKAEIEGQGSHRFNTIDYQEYISNFWISMKNEVDVGRAEEDLFEINKEFDEFWDENFNKDQSKNHIIHRFLGWNIFQ
jgi:hypothetical protein